MAGFHAESAVEPLDYDFRPAVDASGTIPEPTQARLEAFFEAIRQIGTEQIAGIDSDSAPGEIAKAVSDLPDDAVGSTLERITHAIADLCQGTPSLEEIQALPIRLQSAFRDWLLAEITDPTRPNAASRRSPVHRNGAIPAT